MTHVPGIPVSFDEPSAWTTAVVHHTGEPLPCPACRVPNVVCRTHESSCGGWEDEQFRCLSCGHEWWVDGIDS